MQLPTTGHPALPTARARRTSRRYPPCAASNARRRDASCLVSAVDGSANCLCVRAPIPRYRNGNHSVRELKTSVRRDCDRRELARCNEQDRRQHQAQRSFWYRTAPLTQAPPISMAPSVSLGRSVLKMAQNGLRKSGQDAKWSFCLTAGTMGPRIRSDHGQTSTPESHAGLQGKGGTCRHQADLAIMRRLDRLHLEFPFAGARMLRGLLSAEGCKIGRRHVTTLMRRMGIEALYRRPRLATASRTSSTLTRARSSPAQPSPVYSPTTALRSAWTAKAPGGTTCSSSGSGAASNTRRSTCEPTTASARPAHRSVGTLTSRRPHSSLDGTTPDQAYFTPLPLRLAA